MTNTRRQLERLLLDRVAEALSSLPDGGREATQERRALVDRTVAKFLKDCQTVADDEQRAKHGLQ